MIHILRTIIQQKEIFRQGLSYIIVGLLAMLVDFGTLYILVENVHLNYLLSVCFAFFVAAAFNFFAQKKFTFKNKDSSKYQFLSFLIIGAIGMGINVLVVFISVKFLGLWYFIGKLFATGIAFVWNFLSNKFITFK